jgi:hypothetical protein
MYRRVTFEDLGSFLRVRFLPLNDSCDIPLYDGSLRRKPIDVSVDIIAYVESKYRIRYGEIECHGKENIEFHVAKLKIETMKSPNWMSIPPPFSHASCPVSRELYTPPIEILLWCRAYDEYVFKVIRAEFARGCGFNRDFLVQHIWKIPANERHGHIGGLPWDRYKAGVPKLSVLAASAASIYNRMFTGDSLGPYIVSSTSKMYPDKIVRLVEKYATDTRVFSPSIALANEIGIGIDLMLDYMDVKKHKETLVWTFHPDDVKKIGYAAKSSAGLRPNNDRIITDEFGIDYKITGLGQKQDQIELCRIKLLDMIERFLEHGERIEIDEVYSHFAFKQEIFNGASKLTPEARNEFYLKCREFFIPHLMQYLIAALVQKDRQMFERGKMIQIGRRWNYGGAQQFADQMRYDDPDMIYFDGDFKSLDTSIKKFFLETYSVFAAYYYKKGCGHYDLFLELLRVATNNLSVKNLHIAFGVWITILGVMPSGDYSTSSGNSWIVGLTFFSFLAHVITTNPYRADEILGALRDGRIQFPVYGDDHVMGVPKFLEDLINEYDYAAYVKKHFGMTIQKIRRVPFLSEPTPWGGVKGGGNLLILKRNFIKNWFSNGRTKIVAYRSIDDVLHKIIWGNTKKIKLADYIISCIGNAYDNAGTNKFTHFVLQDLFRKCCSAAKIFTNADLKRHYLQNLDGENAAEWTKLMRKACISRDEFYEGFPTLEKLHARHVYDAAYVDFSHEVKSYASRYT